VNECQAKSDGDAGKADSGALRGGANDYVHEKEGSEDFDQETRPEALFAGAKIAVTHPIGR